MPTTHRQRQRRIRLLLLGVAAGAGILIALGQSDDAQAADSSGNITDRVTTAATTTVTDLTATAVGKSTHEPRTAAPTARARTVTQHVETATDAVDTAAADVPVVGPAVDDVTDLTDRTLDASADAADALPAKVIRVVAASPSPNPRAATAGTAPAPPPSDPTTPGVHLHPPAERPVTAGKPRPVTRAAVVAADLTPDSPRDQCAPRSTSDGAATPPTMPLEATGTSSWGPDIVPDGPLWGGHEHRDGRTLPPSCPSG